MSPDQSVIPLNFSPAFGAIVKFPKNISAANYRRDNPTKIWKYNPWTGVAREQANINTDTMGATIIPVLPE